MRAHTNRLGGGCSPTHKQQDLHRLSICACAHSGTLMGMGKRCTGTKPPRRVDLCCLLLRPTSQVCTRVHAEEACMQHVGRQGSRVLVIAAEPEELMARDNGGQTGAQCSQRAAWRLARLEQAAVRAGAARTTRRASRGVLPRLGYCPCMRSSECSCGPHGATGLGQPLASTPVRCASLANRWSLRPRRVATYHRVSAVSKPSSVGIELLCRFWRICLRFVKQARVRS